MNSQSSNNPLNTYVMYSGGAYGADQIFGVLAHKYGVGKQFHIRPQGNTKIHKDLVKLGYQPKVADPNVLATAYDKIKELLGLNLRHGIAGDLKARNYYQVSISESVLAVAHLNQDNTVKGGTSVAVDLAIVLNLPVYVLDVTTENWFMYDYNESKFIQFKDVPPLSRKFTAVGTRDIEDYNIKDRDSGLWVSRPQFVGHDKATRLVHKMEQVFIKATENTR